MRTLPGYQLSDNDKALIRGMSSAQIGFNPYMKMVCRHYRSNIAALHFDGPVLEDMIEMFGVQPKLPKIG